MEKGLKSLVQKGNEALKRHKKEGSEMDTPIPETMTTKKRKSRSDELNGRDKAETASADPKIRPAKMQRTDLQQDNIDLRVWSARDQTRLILQLEMDVLFGKPCPTMDDMDFNTIVTQLDELGVEAPTEKRRFVFVSREGLDIPVFNALSLRSSWRTFEKNGRGPTFSLYLEDRDETDNARRAKLPVVTGQHNEADAPISSIERQLTVMSVSGIKNEDGPTTSEGLGDREPSNADTNGGMSDRTPSPPEPPKPPDKLPMDADPTYDDRETNAGGSNRLDTHGDVRMRGQENYEITTTRQTL